MAEVSVRYGGKNGTAFGLETNDDLVVVRTHQRMLVARAPLSPASPATETARPCTPWTRRSEIALRQPD